ncbi:MAG: hypothetical protein ACREPR_02160 [Brasilonema sp.]
MKPSSIIIGGATPPVVLLRIEMSTFVPEYFIVPEEIDTADFCLRVLNPEYADLDYKAVIESKSRLGNVFSEAWPEVVTSPIQNLEYIKQDHEDFQKRLGFSYIILNLDLNRSLGCAYIFPSLFEGYEAAVYFWVHIQLMDTDFEKNFEFFLKNWIQAKWPFNKVAYPGRDLPWNEWLSRAKKLQI